ncbi:metal-dependent hydrolase [Streptomyces sp. JV184]|uniref:metal-dependent hydrolase n=1 Tax=Streptomyces sp. JV184 TaxID=858637 RepID=UPI002E75CC25|nr:metal-dependent hydrolase [Streptomyces sp. JV184]MEE1750518.1 metal-dependent hydrolase [Streptomyces sp. JV184]
MTEPTTPFLNDSTLVSFPSGALDAVATVRHAVALTDRYGLICDATPFHPEDHTWPDQPGDQGTVEGGGRAFEVLDSVIAAAHRSTGEVRVAGDIPVRRGDPDWSWHVLHVVADDPRALLGREVRLSVDPERRAGLSAGHTGCELVGPALNAALRDRWRKEAGLDSLGAPDFDKIAIVSSRIGLHHSVDRYRMGKSLRRKGFTADGLAEALGDLEAQVNVLLAEWVAADVPVLVRTEGPSIADVRRFSCEVGQGPVTALCGGTHVATTGELGRVVARLELADGGQELVLSTSTGGAAT